MNRESTTSTSKGLFADETGVSDLENHPDGDDTKEADTQNDDAKAQGRRWGSTLLVLLCVFMHVNLVAFFAILVGFLCHSNGQAFTVDKFVPSAFEDNNLFTKVALVPNAVIKIYLVPLTYITQLLALRRDLHLKQSLSAMHDKSQAWMSLFSSGVTVFRYTDLRKSSVRKIAKLREELSSLATVFGIFMYLAGCLVLGIIAPDLITAFVHSGKGDTFDPLVETLPSVGTNTSLIQDAYPIINLLSLLVNSPNVNLNGLLVNIIYDIPLFVSDDATPVNATSFGVSCKSIAGASQVGDFNSSTGSVRIHVHDDLMDIDITPLPRSLNIRPAVWREPSDKPVPPVLLLASTVPIADDNGSQGNGLLSLNAALTPDPCASASDCALVSLVQLVACTVSETTYMEELQVDTINYPYITPNDTTDAASDILNSAYNLPDTWSDWTNLETTQDPILANIGSFASISPMSRTTRSFKLPNSTRTGNYTFSMLEEAVMEAAGYYAGESDSFRDPDLWSMEFTLVQAVSTVFFRAALTSESISAGDNLNYGPTDLHYYLEIKPWQPWLGLGITTMMLILAAILTRQPAPRHPSGHGPHVSGLSVLELTWLLASRDKTEIIKRMKELKDPRGPKLREHGKTVDVDFTGY